MKKKILFILIIAISSLYSKSNNDKINSLAITNEIIKPSDELLNLLKKNKKKTGVLK